MGLATLIRYSLAAIALLAAQASSAGDPLSGHFLDPAALREQRLDGSPLLAGIKPPQLEPRTTAEAYQVSSSMLLDQDDKTAGFLVLVNGADGGFVALVNTPERRGVVIGKADGSQTFREEVRPKEQPMDYIDGPQTSWSAGDAKPGVSDDQDVVLTVLAGFSEEAVRQVGDPRAFALAQIETLNLALRNTGITHIRIALSGIETTPIDYVINGENLDKILTMFPNYPKADLVAGFFASEMQDNIVGIAYRNRNISMTNISTTDTFAHEIGHNVGGDHCYDGGPFYHFGIKNERYGTLLCQGPQLVLAFSNPANRDPDGNPMGDAKTANMALTWRLTAPYMTSGQANDSGMPMLIYSLMDKEYCVAALDRDLRPGTAVGLMPCDAHSAAQRWNKLYVDGKTQFWLAARPKLCLDDEPGDASERNVILSDGGCQYVVWTEESNRLRLIGNGEYLYLHRSSDNKLTTRSKPPSDSSPSYNWGVDFPYGQIRNDDNDLCLESENGSSGAAILLSRCVMNKPTQRWVWDSSGHFRSQSRPELCLGRSGTSGDIPTLLNCVSEAENVTWTRYVRQIIADVSPHPLCLHGVSAGEPDQPARLTRCENALQKNWVIQPNR